MIVPTTEGSIPTHCVTAHMRCIIRLSFRIAPLVRTFAILAISLKRSMHSESYARGCALFRTCGEALCGVHSPNNAYGQSCPMPLHGECFPECYRRGTIQCAVQRSSAQ